MATSYDNFGGSGDRRGIIGVSTDFVHNSTPEDIIDGNTSTSFRTSSTISTGKSITINFYNYVDIDEVKINVGLQRQQDSWEIYSVDEDGNEEFVADIGVIVSNTVNVKPIPLTRFYKMKLKTKVIGNAYYHIKEIEFKTSIPINKTLILNRNEYKKFDDNGWQTVSATLPSSEQFQEEGMDKLTPLLDRQVTELPPMQMEDKTNILFTNGEVGKVFSKTIDLKKYFDIRSLKVEVK